MTWPVQLDEQQFLRLIATLLLRAMLSDHPSVESLLLKAGRLREGLVVKVSYLVMNQGVFFSW
jgi:hypothetical protein